MASFYVRDFNTGIELQDFLNDVVVGKVPINLPLDLKGLTLVFTTPAATVTFTGSEMYPKDIIEEINTQCTAQVARARNYMQGNGQDIRVALVRENDVLASGTAMAKLGLVAVTVGANKIPKAIIAIGNKGANGDTFMLVYEA